MKITKFIAQVCNLPSCGAYFYSRSPTKKYCCREHREQHRQELLDNKYKDVLNKAERICGRCGNKFKPYYITQYLCSRLCFIQSRDRSLRYNEGKVREEEKYLYAKYIPLANWEDLTRWRTEDYRGYTRDVDIILGF